MINRKPCQFLCFALILCTILAATGSSVVAQNSFVLPPGYAAKDGGSYFYYMTWYNRSNPYTPTHVQMVWDTTVLPIIAGQIKGIAFRRSGYLGNMNYAATGTYKIDMSVGPNDSTTVSTTYAANHGSNMVTVYQGNIIFPDEARPSSGLANFNIVIPFKTPFIYNGATGKGLVVDVTCSTYTLTSTAGFGSWNMDQVKQPIGKLATNLHSTQCKFNNGKYPGSMGFSTSTLVPGGYWYAQYTGILPNAPGVVALGSVGVGGTWGPLTLPIDLTPMGAPGCYWASDIIIMVTGLTTTASGGCRVPNQAIPNAPVLGGAIFYTQPAWVDVAANAMGVVTGGSHKWTIGGGTKPPCSYVYMYRDSTPPATLGYLRKNHAPVTKFLY